MTAELGIAEQFAREGADIAVPKTRAFVAVKRVGVHIGLKASDLMLLDTLGAFTQPQDWEEGRRPVVWMSNALLMEQTGFSLSALKRHLRRLVAIGVVAFRDSSNGKRWGRRDAEGHIIEAYGVDLSPLAARAEEFESLYAEVQAERALCQSLRRQITVTRRMIRARLDAALNGGLRGAWGQFIARFEGLLTQLPGPRTPSAALADILDLFRVLLAKVDAAFLGETECAKPTKPVDQQQDMNPTGVINGPHIRTTNELHTVESNCLETKPVEAGAPKDDCRRKSDLDLPTIMQACPEFTTWARTLAGYLKTWDDVHRVAGQLRPMIGVSEQAWDMAQDRMGSQTATIAMILVFEKHCTGEVTSPGGYLRGMVEKYKAGDLHLERSFYGRLTARAA